MVDAQIRASRTVTAYETIVAAAQGGSPIPAAEAVADADPRVQELSRRLDEARLRADLARAKPGGGDKAAADEADVEANVLARHLEARRTAVTAKAKATLLEQAQARVAEARSDPESLVKKIDNLKADLGELANAMTVYHNLQEEQRALRDQLKSIREQIEAVMAIQSSAAATDIHWQQMPEVELPKR
jgi:DNA repair exonuclease SbcCD ATPase subunit